RPNVLMYQTLVVRVLEAPGKLNGDIQNSFERFFRATFIQSARTNPILKTAAVDELQKEPRNASQLARVMTGDDVRKQSQSDPRIHGFHKVLGLFLSFKRCLAWTLYREVDIPFAMVYSIDKTPGAGPEHIFDFV